MLEGSDEKYRQMQKNYYGQFDAQNDDIIKSHVVGCYGVHEQYPYEKYLLEYLPETEDKVALDFGCGPGRMILRMSPRFKRVDGVDISPSLIEAAARWTADVPNKPKLYVNSGALLDSVPSAEYDFVYSTIAFHHIAPYNIRLALLYEFFRVLKNNGRISIQMFFTKQPRYEWMHHAEWRENKNYVTATNGWHDVRITPTNLPLVKEDFERIGFVDFEPTMAPYPPPPHPVESATDWIFLNARKP